MPGEQQTFTDPANGATYTIPRYSQTTTLSAAQQAIKDQQDRAKMSLSTTGADLSEKLGAQLTSNFTLDNNATEGRLFELGRRRLDPMLAERQSSLDSKLANQGFSIGSKGYETAQRQNMNAENDAYTSLLLNGRAQAAQELLAQDNQRLNQTNALLTGSQVSMPTFGANTNQPTLPTVDTAGLINENFNQKMNIAQQKNAATQSILGGLFGLGAGLLRSDRKVKKDIKRIGTADNGLPIYSYTYNWGGPVQIGFMADEVEKVHPDAVVEIGGIKSVNYALAVEAA